MTKLLYLVTIVLAFAYVGFASSLLIAAEVGWNFLPMSLLMVFGVWKLFDLVNEQLVKR